MWFKWNDIFNSDVRTQMDPNDLNYAQINLNESKSGKTTLNKPKWPQMSWYGSISTQTFVKFLLVMGVSVRQHIIYDF